MSEPTTLLPASLTAAVIAFLGPLAGQYALIVVGGLAGALLALSATKTTGKQAAWMLLRLVLAAIALTSSLAWWAQTRYDIPAAEILSPIAFVIGLAGDQMIGAIRRGCTRLAERLLFGGREL